MLHPLQPPTQLTSPIQYRRPSSHLAPRTRERVHRATAAEHRHGYERRFDVDNMTCLRVPLRLPSFLGAQAWYCVSAIRNAHTPAPGANASTNWHAYFRPPSVAALAPPALAAVALHRTGTSYNDARLEQQTTGLLHNPRARDRPLQRPRTHRAPHTYCSEPNSPAEERHQARGGKVGDNWVISHSSRFRTSMPIEEPHSHPRAGPSASSDSGGNRAPHPPQRRGRHDGPSWPKSRSVPEPPKSGSATSCVGLPVMRLAAVAVVVNASSTTMSCSPMMSANAP